MRRHIKIFSSVLLLSSLAYSGSNTGADFLQIPIGARAVALGQAYSALAQGPNSLNWNPAGISRLPSGSEEARLHLSYSHQELFLDTSLDNLGLVLPTNMMARPLNWGFSVTRLGHAKQEGRSIDRTQTGSFGAQDIAVGAALSTKVGKGYFGTQVKYIRQELAGFQANGTAVDFGFLSPTRFSRLSVGGSVRNLGPKMKFIEEDFDLPLTVSAGLSFEVLKPLTLGFDVVSKPRQDEVSFAIGSEFYAVKNITLRAGYLSKIAEAVSNNQESETNRGNVAGLNGMTAGVGLILKELSLDYAFSQFGELGFTHSLTLSSWFGGPDAASDEFQLPDHAPSSIEDLPEPKDQLESTEPDRVIIIFMVPLQSNDWWSNLTQ